MPREPTDPRQIRQLDNIQRGFFHNTIYRRVKKVARRIPTTEDRAVWLTAVREIKGELLIKGPPPESVVFSKMRRYSVLARNSAGEVLCNVNGQPKFQPVQSRQHRTITV